MSGPWTQYQSKEGPWSNYAPTEMGAGERFVQGARDPLDASAQMLVKSLPEGIVSGVNRATAAVNELPIIGPVTRALGMTPATPAQIDTGIREREEAYRPPEGFDWARLGGNLATTIPLAGKVPVGNTLKARAALGGASGAGFGALQPVVENQENFGTEKLKQAGIGATVGAAAAPILGGLARMVQPQTRPEAAALMREGVTPTPGQILGGPFQAAESKLESLPILGDAITSARRAGIDDLNRAAMGRAMNPIGQQAPKEVGREGVAKVSAALSDAYNNLLPKLSFRADQQFAAEFNNVRAMAASLPQAEADQFERILQTQVIGKLTPQGNASGETIKQVESELGRLVRGYKGDPSFDKRQIGAALEEIQTSIRTTLQRTNPQHADELAKINEGYSNFVRIRDAASRQGSAEGVFTPAQLSAAVRAQDRSAGKGNFARGTAQMQDLSDPAKSVLGQSYPNSGTAGRLFLSGGALGAGFLEPTIPIGLGLASLPYLPGGRQAAAALLTSRPAMARPLAGALRRVPGGLLAPPIYEIANQ